MSKFRVHFDIYVEVDMPEIKAETGDEVYNEYGDQTISDDQWNKIVSDAVNQLEDPENSVVDIVCTDGDPEDGKDGVISEEDDEMYNNSPEYIHDAALDWMNEHADFLNDIGQDRFIKRCAEELAEEGYNTEEYYWAVEEAFDDMDWDRPEYDD